MNYKRILRFGLPAIIAALAFFDLARYAAPPVFAQSGCDGACREALSAARNATNQYHEEPVAVTAGFVPTSECVPAMGYHYVFPSRAMDLILNVTEPELLLYEKMSNGKMRLVGVEYFVPVITSTGPWFDPVNPPQNIVNPPPKLFGQTFNGPMPGHEPGMPWHYDLHVWVWKHNPNGMFAPFNPTVTCPN